MPVKIRYLRETLLANHWKRWDAKPGAVELTLYARPAAWQTTGNRGTAKPEAKGPMPYARSATGLLCVRNAKKGRT